MACQAGVRLHGRWASDQIAQEQIAHGDGDGTLLKYTVNAAIGGKLAQIGARLIDGAAHKMAEEFFASFAANVAGPAPVAAAAAAAPAEVPPAPPGTAAAVGAPRPSEGIRPWIWVGGLIIIAIILLLYFGRL